MSLGERIHQLRSALGLSQGDLADQLGVSRQSVSKWETDSATPDLEKLIKLSDMFDISLDELVRGDSAATSSPSDPPEASPAIIIQHSSGLPGRKIAGTILLCMAFLAFLLGSLLSDALTGLLLSLPLLLWGGICFALKKHILLWGGWVTLILWDIFSRFATGIHWRTTLSTLLRSKTLPTFYWIFLCVQLLAIITLVCCTAWTFRRAPIQKKTGFRAGCTCAAGLFAFSFLPFPHWMMSLCAVPPMLTGLLYCCISSGQVILLAILLTNLARWYSTRKEDTADL